MTMTRRFDPRRRIVLWLTAEGAAEGFIFVSIQAAWSGTHAGNWGAVISRLQFSPQYVLGGLILGLLRGFVALGTWSVAIRQGLTRGRQALAAAAGAAIVPVALIVFAALLVGQPALVIATYLAIPILVALGAAAFALRSSATGHAARPRFA